MAHRKDPSKLRSLSHGRILSRSPLKSHYLAAREGPIGVEPENLSTLEKFRKTALWAWVGAAIGSIKSYIGTRHDFQDPLELESGAIYKMPGVTRIAVAGDWGTGGYEAEASARGMQKNDAGNSEQPDFTLHIGDVYYVGSEDEFKHNCSFSSGSSVVCWPRGSKGSFSLLGNHEMFSRGIPYFDVLLPNLGMATDGKYPNGQGSSVFCLENDDWMIVGLDTGYNSVKWFVQFGLRDENIEWLKQRIFTAERKGKGVILMSHHQYFSRFEGDYTKTAKQLAEIGGFLTGREVLWLWGHEHRFSGYQLSTGMDLAVHGRCIGHSGMPVEIAAPDTAKSGVPPLAFYDNRKNSYYSEPTGMNGYCFLDFNGPHLTITYYDAWWAPIGGNWGTGASGSEKILVEKFQNQNGSVKLTERRKISSNPDLIVVPIA
ncbi:MAG: metallophosphoesterase [Bacteroidota bacterium]|nr:metallophosphoesterase [Bacteroidota bacterium]MDP4230082.1 metallophosphoesterase [Bacteroidota bacterium]MDP4235733.1 metallophosphoesterase [Bacteroidota bacterium]